MKKFKILMISDHLLSTSGVGVQSRYVAHGLIKTGKYQFRQLGAAVKHNDYNTIHVSDDLIIKPIDGFGSPDLLRVALATEKPDALFLFNDPRFFTEHIVMSDEIHDICPIVWWNIWDDCNHPPVYNKLIYDSVDLLNCINYPTYEFLSKLYADEPWKANFVPHALPDDMFKPLPADRVQADRRMLFEGQMPEDTFVALWIARNARRKCPGDMLQAWRMFLDELKAKEGHTNALLVMHTDPFDQEGPNLHAIVDHLDLARNVKFSIEKLGFEEMCRLHNCADVVVNNSSAEGFGLPLLEALYSEKPVICPKIGGMTRQVVNHETGEMHGIGLDPDVSSLVGSQTIPYIFDHFIRADKLANAIHEVRSWGPEKRKDVGKRAREYALKEFSMEKMIQRWDQTLEDCILNWRARYKRWETRNV